MSVRIDVTPTAEAVDPDSLVAATVLIVDVLRASTTMTAALAGGAAAIVPVPDAEEARRRRAAAGDVLLAGERRGNTIDGFDLGNSPVEFAAAPVRGKTVIFTTSNGTRALLAARGAAAVGVAALVNLTAASAWALAPARDVSVICAGERGAPSLEDLVCAGLLVERMKAAEPGAQLSSSAVEAARAARPYAKHVARLRMASSWARHLVRSGRGGDVDACLALDTTTIVPVYLPNVDKVVCGPR
ncbi:MAG TPA: 2-phosphosulfolactate phosphatase [Methylomirabilota bacterium]